MLLLMVLLLFYSLHVLLSILCVLCFCIVLCIVSPYIYSVSFLFVYSVWTTVTR
jgi:hypothetical protein